MLRFALHRPGQVSLSPRAATTSPAAVPCFVPLTRIGGFGYRPTSLTVSARSDKGSLPVLKDRSFSAPNGLR